ncbi:CoA transferase [Mycolicibacterium sp. F2034L]|uniref:CaiB/BaiF CoA-transferase family protein n=1 Tax=Mycolicibacterium sp. F2034L TaxID=2926422 RepID=UPI001FF48B92|nr:CoA transferase [Mycolicibacterium sp. F2034L]MCK0173845.1 CoA transferase [Mycolicibacterium sp. F2034L]
MSDYDPPLSGVRILDLSSGPMTAVGRLLADLGADVAAVELRGVTVDDAATLDTMINRHGITAETVADATRWAELVAGADILIESTRPGSAAEATLDVRGLRTEHPGLVILSISDFGRDNEFREWQATTPVLLALSSELARSGIPGRVPLVPPGELPYHAAAAQAAVATLSVFLDRLRTGEGDLIDFSVLEGAMQALDPPFGTLGSAAAGVPITEQRRDWNSERQRYPILRCKDGYIRICILAKRQWRGMFEWMDRPEEFADPKFDRMGERFRSPDLLPAIERFTADKTRADLEREGQRHGVPTAAVLTLDEAITSEQCTARGFFRDVELTDGLTAPVPVGVIEVDGHRASTLDTPASQQARPTGAPVLAGRFRRDEGLPLEGIRVLDLGVIVVGADTGRLFADLGADVVKIENSAYPDGMRTSLTKMTQAYAAGHRNKRSIGIDLRSEEGRKLAYRLAEQVDVVLSNFKPGVAQALGMDFESLRTINPGIVVVESSAFGPTGPWARSLGYGPLVRAKAGFTDRWVYPEEPGSFCDTVTVYPDHVSARIGALAALALLLRRERTNAGGGAAVAQSEVMLSHLAPQIAAATLSRPEPERDAPWAVLPAAGDDQWVAVTVRGDADWRALCEVLQRPDLAAELATRADRDRERDRVDAAVGDWLSTRTAAEAMTTLQAAGVPAGAVLHPAEVPQWEYFVARRDFRDELHPYGTTPFTLENVVFHSDHVPDPPLGQAPLLGEQTAEVAAELLGLGAAEVADLMERGVLETVTPPA